MSLELEIILYEFYEDNAEVCAHPTGISYAYNPNNIRRTGQVSKPISQQNPYRMGNFLNLRKFAHLVQHSPGFLGMSLGVFPHVLV